ncbi:hypothetical protein R0381_002587 [Jeongeupia wiesaeckerbachi]|uniref:hypothetical protein n=1 Tax=Jeongeupia wiesaeckerbachi TaxID=3051218 RepID=UPI003D806385
MIYLYCYLGTGVVVLALVFGTRGQTKENESGSPGDFLGAANPHRKKRWYRILSNVVALSLTTAVGVVVWPVLIYLKAKEVFGKKSAFAFNEEPKFVVERGHLQERLTVLQIEAREVVADPLGAVSNLPFGHLNAAWKNFIEGIGAGDDLWSFTACWQTSWGRNEVRAGYVVVREGVPASHFLTMWKEVGPSTTSSKKASDKIPAWLRKQAD